MADEQAEGAGADDRTNHTESNGGAGSDGSAGGRHAVHEPGSGDGGSGSRAPAEAPTTVTPDERPTTASSEGTPTTATGEGTPTTRIAGEASGDATRHVPGEPGRAAAEAPTAVQARPAPAPTPAPAKQARQPLQRSSVDIGAPIRKIAGTVGTVLRLIGFLFAAVIIVYILLAVVGVNPQNGVARTVGGFADVLVLDFRDLFLIPDRTLGLVVNYGLAAIVWMVAGVVASTVVRAVARLVP